MYRVKMKFYGEHGNIEQLEDNVKKKTAVLPIINKILRILIVIPSTYCTNIYCNWMVYLYCFVIQYYSYFEWRKCWFHFLYRINEEIKLNAIHYLKRHTHPLSYISIIIIVCQLHLSCLVHIQQKYHFISTIGMRLYELQ